MMEFRLAAASDLPQLKQVFARIADKLNRENGEIWDDYYPCELFAGDIENGRLYVLMDGETPVSAFALCDENAGSAHIQWAESGAKALYLDRFGVNVDYARKGLGSSMLRRAIDMAAQRGYDYLRLFVVDINRPAAAFYCKNGLRQAQGIYVEQFDDGFELREYGYETNKLR